MIFSIPIPSTVELYACSTTPRVSASHSSSRISYFVKSLGCGEPRRPTRSSCLLFCASNPRETAERNSPSNVAAATPAVASSSTSDHHHVSPPPRSFLDARSEQDLLMVIQKEAEAGRLPINIAQGMAELYHNYRDAVLRSEHPKADEIVMSNMAIVLDRVFSDVQDPFQFSPYHTAIREPFDYYTLGQKYIRPLVDFRNSFLGNSSTFYEIEKKLEQGENIILMSNHQTEADPAVIALLLESTSSFIAENLIYVAGDRVITDPLSKPFSMGRNLLCVYSKKHMSDDPMLIDMKRRANTKSLKEMALLLRTGAKIIWIAPSGGRDRPDPVTKEWHPAPFDSSSVDNMRRLVEHAGVPGRIYPLAIMCHEIMPPPLEVEKEIGERREISFHGVGVSVGPAIDYHKIYSALDDPDEAKSMYSESLYSSICLQYDVLKSAIYGKQGLKASSSLVSLTQPWL
ncbi:glycerol-3-phosphate acyltransferase ATS11, chloroplastic-like isoform X1 [Salvia splendens]|uniref:glycerol-3-phosphate acyltransferase ATS11, chloroplastic-like isoform X1 n=1 Tax=Salvia splendens TaxID=180675 RepID=UPI001C27EBE5|nr:glycerol-3-phosphate acyltransferase ATS11, chloroplastic-like isoform X1 [Salvia splendens]